MILRNMGSHKKRKEILYVGDITALYLQLILVLHRRWILPSETSIWSDKKYKLCFDCRSVISY